MINSIIKYTTAIAIGCIVGFMGGLQGIAGGFYISTLLLLSGIAKNQTKAAGTTLLAMAFPISAGAVYEYWKSDNIDIPVALIVTFFYIIFSWIGAKVNPYFSESIIMLSLALLLMITSVYFFYKYYTLR
jgi:uncharacterized protein